jgi:MFS family permease
MQAADVALAIYFINELSLRQAIVPQHLLGRVNASFSFVGMAASLLGVLVGGAIGQTFGLRAAVAVGVICGATARLWLTRSPVRDLRAAPEPLPSV